MFATGDGWLGWKVAEAEDEDHEGAVGGEGSGGDGRGWFNPSTNFLIPQLQSGSLWDQYGESSGSGKPSAIGPDDRARRLAGAGTARRRILAADLSPGWRKRGRGYASPLVNRDGSGVEKDGDRR